MPPANIIEYVVLVLSHIVTLRYSFDNIIAYHLNCSLIACNSTCIIAA